MNRNFNNAERQQEAFSGYGVSSRRFGYCPAKKEMNELYSPFINDSYAEQYDMYDKKLCGRAGGEYDMPYAAYTDNSNSLSNDIAKREKALEIREMRFFAKQLLMQNRLPAELADIIRTDDEKTVMTAVQMLLRFRDGSDSRYASDKFKVLDEKRLPEAETDPGQVSDLRRAFGLV